LKFNIVKYINEYTIMFDYSYNLGNIIINNIIITTTIMYNSLSLYFEFKIFQISQNNKFCYVY
jgi:hypothetical protein